MRPCGGHQSAHGLRGSKTLRKAQATSYLSQAEIGRIVELRAARRISQRELAAAVDLELSALSRVESGERGMAVCTFVVIAESLEVEPHALLRRKPDALPLSRCDDAGAGRRSSRQPRSSTTASFEAALRR